MYWNQGIVQRHQALPTLAKAKKYEYARHSNVQKSVQKIVDRRRQFLTVK